MQSPIYLYWCPDHYYVLLCFAAGPVSLVRVDDGGCVVIVLGVFCCSWLIRD